MSTDIIVSYDGSPNDDDGLALGRLLAQTGASLALAYVRHAREFDPRREQMAQYDAERRLEQGAEMLEAPDTPSHVVVSRSTTEGLEQLAQAEGAALIVFGSDYRTPPGHAEPGNTAQQLLEGGPIAVAIAAAGLRTEVEAAIESIAVAAPDEGAAAQRTADALSAKIGARVLAAGDRPADLIIVASQPSSPAQRVALSGMSRAQLNSARGSVLVVPHDKPVLL